MITISKSSLFNIEFYEKISNFFIKQENQHLEMSNNIKKVYSGIDKLCDLRQAELDETRRHNKCMEELTAEKIRIKLQIKIKSTDF